MDLKWEFRTRVPYSELTAEVTEDTGEYRAIITGRRFRRAGSDNEKLNLWPCDSARAVTGGIEVVRRGKN